MLNQQQKKQNLRKEILQQSVTNKYAILLKSIELDDIELVKLVLEKLKFTHQDLNEKFRSLLETANHESPLIYALQRKVNDSIIELLIGKGAKITRIDDWSDPIIHFTRFNPNPPVIKKLIETYDAPIEQRHITKVIDLINKGNPQNEKNLIEIEKMLFAKMIQDGLKSISDDRSDAIIHDDRSDAIIHFTGKPNPLVIKKLIYTYDAPIKQKHLTYVRELIQNGQNDENKKKKLIEIKNMLEKKKLKDKIQTGEQIYLKNRQNMKEIIRENFQIKQQQQLKKKILQLASILNLTSIEKKKIWEDFLVDYYTKQSKGIPLNKWLWAWWKKIIKKFIS